MNTDKISRAREELFFRNSYTRAPRLIAMAASRKFTDQEFLTLLGEFWSTFDNIGLTPGIRVRLERIYRHDPSLLRHLMTDKEAKLHAGLPISFQAYRGCYRRNLNGLSYSLDLAVAQAFPFYGRYLVEGEQAVLVTAQIDRSACVSKLDRKEAEIIAFAPHIVRVAPIKETPPKPVPAKSESLGAEDLQNLLEIERILEEIDF